MTPKDTHHTLNKQQARAALIKAIKAEQIAEVSLLINDYRDVVNAKNAHHNTPLSEAISTGNLDLVKRMVALGADVTNVNHGGSGHVGIALYGGYQDIARYLTKEGAPVTFAEMAGCLCPGQLEAHITDNPDALNTPAISARKLTPLHMATLAGHLPGVEWLLTHGVTPDVTDRHGHTPLAATPECRLTAIRCRIASRLLDAGANPNGTAGHHGGTILDRAIIAGDRALTILLLERGADPNHQDWSGKTALHHAASRNASLTKLVLSFNARTDLRTKNGETACELATRLRKAAVIRCFET